jgi:hypothetical protein
MTVEVSSGSSGIVIILRAYFLRADCLKADRGGGPGFFGFFSGVSGVVNVFDQTPISNFEFQL